MKTKEWEKEFEEEFAGLSSTLFGDVKGKTRDFISSLLSARTEEVIEMTCITCKNKIRLGHERDNKQE